MLYIHAYDLMWITYFY